MLITNHWSVSGLNKLKDYHVEFALTGTVSSITQKQCYALVSKVDAVALKAFNVDTLKKAFTIYKNFPFTQPTTYGTYLINNDPRDNSSNIEIAMLGMDGANVQVQGPWGSHPYTAAHAIMHAAINARVCKLKGINPIDSFPTSIEPSILQNGPIYVLSTHGERALQTNDQGDDTIPERGYFAYSGDSNCRWDIAALDELDAHHLADGHQAVLWCKQSAGILRQLTNIFFSAPIADYWGLNV